MSTQTMNKPSLLNVTFNEDADTINSFLGVTDDRAGEIAETIKGWANGEAKNEGGINGNIVVKNILREFTQPNELACALWVGDKMCEMVAMENSEGSISGLNEDGEENEELTQLEEILGED